MAHPVLLKGIVSEVGAEGRIKVRLPEYDDLITNWVPVLQTLTLGARTWSVPRKDTQVVMLCGHGMEDAVVIGSLYSKPDPAPFKDAKVIGMVADDGVTISYDPSASLLKIQSPREINIIATQINIQADINAQGNIVHQGKQTHTGDTTQTGTLTNTQTISSGIGLTTHKHGGVAGGVSTTSTPVP